MPTDDPTSNEYDDERNDFNFEESGYNTENLSPIDITTASDEIIAQLEQNNYDEETMESRLQHFREMAEEGEESTNEEITVIESDVSEDEDYIIDSDENESYLQEEDRQEDLQQDVQEVLEYSEVPEVGNEEEVQDSDENTFPSPDSQTIPLSVDFLDSLGRLWEEKSEWQKKLSNTKLFDGRGRPIELPPVQTTTTPPEDDKEDEDDTHHLSNTVYVDVGTTEMKEIEKYSTKRKLSKTNDEKPSERKEIEDC